MSIGFFNFNFYFIQKSCLLVNFRNSLYFKNLKELIFKYKTSNPYVFTKELNFYNIIHMILNLFLVYLNFIFICIYELINI